MHTYFLSRTAHLCLSGDHLVILDLRRGDYLGLSMADARALASWVCGWPVGDRDAGPAPARPRVLEKLLQRGVLTADRKSGRSAKPIDVTVQDIWPGDERLDQPPSVHGRDLWRFLLAVVVAACALRWMSLERIVQRVRRRKARCPRQPTLQELFALMTLYGRLRPLLYARKDACLLHSLAVLEFLASYGICADWVFGIRTEPFAAHSWLQYDGRTLTDSPLKLDQFTPILMV